MGFNPINKLNGLLERRLPERRLFLRSDTDTRFIRLSPTTQFAVLFGSAATVAWAMVTTAIITTQAISGSTGDQAQRDLELFQNRIHELSAERDIRAAEAAAAQARFSTALEQVSLMQSELLSSEERVRELSTGIDVIQSNLRNVLAERDDAIDAETAALAKLEGTAEAQTGVSQDEIEQTIDLLADALSATAQERDMREAEAIDAVRQAALVAQEKRLLEEKNNRIFGQLEDAVAVSVEPLDKMFRAAGMPPEKIMETVRRGYSGQGGPLTPITFSTRGQAPDTDAMRANGIIEKMDNLNLYRIAAQKAPFSLPIKSSFRYTSGFGPRWGRMHEGTDFAAAYGTPIFATADGVVTWAGWQNGYGRLVKIQHEFGLETRYAHQSQILVKVGQRVSRGDQIGAMGNSGRSTGTHLHYEVRVGGKPVNPMTYIKAGKDVF